MARMSTAALYPVILAITIRCCIQCQQFSAGAPAPGDVLARISGPARAPTNSVTGNLVVQRTGTVYYGDATVDNLYEGEGAPQNWCKKSPGDPNCLCQTGQKQSPIDLSYQTLQNNNITADLMMRAYPTILTPKYSTQAVLNVTNPGHGTPQINVAPGSPGSTLEFRNRTLEFVQLHFHISSEHTFNSTRADLEAHAVHKDPTTNGIAVLGFLFQKAGVRADPLLEFALASRPNATVEGDNGQTVFNATVVPDVNLQALLSPYMKAHFLYYQGSLTTPPCTEGVQWFLFPRLFDMTDLQFDAFQDYAEAFFAASNISTAETKRPAQPLNQRIVEFY